MHALLSTFLVFFGIFITAFGGFLMSLEETPSLLQFLIERIGFATLLVISVIPGTFLVWAGGLFGRKPMKKWIRIVGIILYILALLLSIGLVTLMYLLDENGFS